MQIMSTRVLVLRDMSAMTLCLLTLQNMRACHLAGFSRHHAWLQGVTQHMHSMLCQMHTTPSD